jgi:hypothetical protein
MVCGERAVAKQLRPYFKVGCSIQTKEERFESTEVPVSFYTCAESVEMAGHGANPLCAGKWVVTALMELERVGRGPTHAPKSLLFANPAGTRWTMSGFWKSFVLKHLQRCREEEWGGLDATDDVKDWGTNSFRRTWNTMASKRPHHVDEETRDKHGRWRKRQMKRQRINQGMSALYNEQDDQEKTRATFFLTLLK